MNKQRPDLTTNLDSGTFREFYYLKSELVTFCRANNLQTTGSKLELTNRIIKFLDTGERERNSRSSRKIKHTGELTLNTIIEENFVCSEKHRAFYQRQIGNNFSFNVTFQKWLKSNPGKGLDQTTT